MLYRAGFVGGDSGHVGLTEQQRQALCAAGFSEARYVDFGSKTTYGQSRCGDEAFVYAPAKSSQTHDVMQSIYNVVKNPEMGPVLVHCMWGVHSSGAVAAMALVQFCGWSESDAKKYWNEARNGADCSGGCDAWIDGKFSRFSIDPTLAISEAEQRAICPP